VDGPSYLWRVEGIDTSVAFSTTVLDALRNKAAGANESGGILLGRIETDEDGCHTDVEAVEPFAIEYRFSTGYSMSGHDMHLLERRLKRRRRGGLAPVGLWRSHHRRGLYLDQRDFAAFQAFFQHPGALFLLMRPDEAGARGGVFVWEDSDVRRHESYLEFPFPGSPDIPRPIEDLPPLAPVAKAAARPNLVPAVEMSDPQPAFAFPPAVMVPKPAAAIVPMPPASVAAMPPTAVAPPVPAVLAPSIPAVRLRLVIRPKPMVLAMLSVLLPRAAFYIGRAVTLARERSGTSAAAVPGDPAQPVASTPVTTPPVEAAPPSVEPPPPALPESRDRMVVAVAPKHVRPMEIPADGPVTINPPALPDPPVVAPRAAVAAVPGILASVKPTTPAADPPKVVAYFKPAPHSLRKVPVLRSLSHNATEGFVPPNPVVHPLPVAPDGAVRVDRNGLVSHVKFSDGNRRLTDKSASALTRWRFEPARQNGEPVESDMLVRFEFRKQP
jgi:protein TonB